MKISVLLKGYALKMDTCRTGKSLSSCRALMPLLLILLLTGCGFHLRGMINAPTWLNNVALVFKVDDRQLHSILQSQLESYAIKVNPDPARAQYWLVVNQIDVQQQIISIGSSTNPRQYTLTLTVDFSLESRKGKVIKTARMVRVSRQLTINNDRILGSTYEENLLIGEMKQDAVVQIINQLSYQN